MGAIVGYEPNHLRGLSKIERIVMSHTIQCSSPSMGLNEDFQPARPQQMLHDCIRRTSRLLRHKLAQEIFYRTCTSKETINWKSTLRKPIHRKQSCDLPRSQFTLGKAAESAVNLIEIYQKAETAVGQISERALISKAMS